MPFKASASGSLMLLGEYAVLQGEQALVCAIDKRISVTLSPRADDQIEIFSSDMDKKQFITHQTAFPSYITSIKQLTIEPPFQFVLGVLKYYQAKLTRGCTLTIESEFSDRVGLGSSAAVTVATLAVLLAWLGIKVSPIELARTGCSIVQRVQGVGSGADIAASVYGGIIAYRAQPFAIEKYTTLYPLTVLYAGFKTPTTVAIKQVEARFLASPTLFRQLYRNIGLCAFEGIQEVGKQAWSQLGEVMTIQQGLLTELGVNMPCLQDMVDSLCAQTGILGAKISGSGLGDCVIGLGHLPDTYTYVAGKPGLSRMTSTSAACTTSHVDSHACVQRIPTQMTVQGVHCEEI